ncbi:MAG: alpha-L-fucosidase [Chthoniobacter sp.]|nr:alpha-L-fucosidase [Chthoniobacter sp.]
MKIRSAFFTLVFLANAFGGQFVPDFRVRPDDFTVLMVPDARVSEGIEKWTSGHGKFFGPGWRKAGQQAEWRVTVPVADDYAVNVSLYQSHGKPVSFLVRAGESEVRGALTGQERGWNRLALRGTLRLPHGAVTVTLQVVSPADDFELSVQSVELVRPAVRKALLGRASSLRADTKWFQDAGYGIMVHWTSESMPRAGERKPYAQAVADFDVEAFASQVQKTGAGFVVLTTSHGQQYFPGPNRALDAILPGRTASRDLVGDLAAALRKRGMKLMLYYHPGAGSDPKWIKASGAMETDTTRFFTNWQRIISEVGERYGDRLAGWWFDDGAVAYYYRSAPWEALHRAARAGFAQRLIGWNPWELPSPTEFQDFYCGEGRAEPSGADALLAKGGDGHYRQGAYTGLQASASLITESDWVHSHQDTAIGPPKWTAAQMADLLTCFRSYRNVPIFNVEIYQTGEVSPATVAMFQEARRMASNGGNK